VRQFSFEHLDPSRFRAHDPPGNLNGEIRLHAAGRNLGDAVATASVHLHPSRIDRFELERLVLEAGLNRGGARAQGEVATSAGRLSFAGWGRPFDSVPSYDLRQLNFADLDLSRLLQKKDLPTRLTGLLTSEGRGKNLQSAELEGTLELRQSVVGRARISRGRIDANLKGGAVELVGKLHGEHDSLLVGAAMSPFVEHPPVKLVARLPFAELAAFLQPDTVPDARGAAYLALSGTLGRPESMQLQAELQAGGKFHGVTLDSLGARVRLRNGALQLDTLELRSNVAAASGSGVLGLFGPARSGPAGLRLVARLRNVAPLTASLGMSDFALDSGAVTATAEGTSDSLRLAMAFRSDGLVKGAQRFQQLAGSGRAELTRKQLVVGNAEVSAQGIRSGNRWVQSIHATGSFHQGELVLRSDLLVDARHEAQIAARLHPKASEDQLQLETVNLRVEQRRWALRHPVAITYGKRIRVNDLVLSAGPHRIAVDGVIDPNGDQAFKVNIDSLQLGELSELLGKDQLDGVLNSSAELSGSAGEPRLTAKWDVDARSRKRDVGRIRGNLEWSNRGLVLATNVHSSKGDSLIVNGRIPLALTLAPADSAGKRVSRIPAGELVFDAVGDNVDISKFQPLFNPEKLQIGGRLFLNAHARGSFEALRLAGDIVVRQAEFRITPLARYHDGLLRLALEGEEARIVEGRFESGEGEAVLGGKIGFGEFPMLTLDIGAKLRKFAALSDDQLRAGATGDVHLGGDVKNPRLSITARLQNTDYYLKAKNLETSAEAVELSPADLRILEQRFGPAVVTQSKKVKGLLPPWALDWKMTLGDNVWLRRRSDPVMAVELAGNLEVRKEPNQELQAFGKIQPVIGRSFVQLMSRRFDLRSGDVTLNGPLKRARIGLEAEYRTTEAGGSTPIVIIATLKSDTGLVIQLDSRPVMREADIMSYLTTGRPASTDPTLQSDEQDVLATGAGLAVGAALGSVAGKAGQSLGLDVVQVLQDREGGQTVVAGKYVSAPLYLGFRQPIVPASSNSRSSSTQQNAVELEMEYAALRDILVNLQAGGSEMRVFLKLRR
jgi:autotransporter translocation and assembly factor TamB